MKALRTEIARLLAGIPLDQVDAKAAGQLRALFRDFLAAASFNADMPESRIMLGHFHTDRQDFEAAEKAYEQALAIARDTRVRC